MLALAFYSDFDYKHMERITRYITTMEPSYLRALKVLNHAQEKRRNLPNPAEIVPLAESAPPEKAAAATSPILHPFDQPIPFGFESQNQVPSFVPRC